MEEVKLFSKNHIWVSSEGKVASMGISSIIHKKLGEVIFLNLPEIGEKLEIGKRFGDVEGVKMVFDLISPVDGEVMEINQELFEEQEEIDEEKFHTWFIKAKYSRMDENLMNEESYFDNGEKAQ